jgi:hypothetical protein
MTFEKKGQFMSETSSETLNYTVDNHVTSYWLPRPTLIPAGKTIVFTQDLSFFFFFFFLLLLLSPLARKR